ncbi:MAG: metallophosphoesterase [Bacteroidota bacterium]
MNPLHPSRNSFPRLFLLLLVAAAMPSRSQTVQWTAYNDLSWRSGEDSTRITAVSTNQTGILRRYDTGGATSVRLTVTNAAPTRDTIYGAEPRVGTDAYGIFHGIVSCKGFIWYKNYVDTNITLTFRGLRPQMRYTLVFYGNRNDYGWTRGSEVVLSGTGGFRNRSSTGTDSLTHQPLFAGETDSSTVLPAGNTDSGFVARFDSVRSGSDSMVVLTVRYYGTAGNQYKGKYSSALMVREIEPGGSASYLLGVSVTGSGSVTRSPDLPSYPSGTVVELTAVPDTLHRFARWGGALSGSTSPANITMDGPKDVTALFMPGTGNTTRFMIVGDSRQGPSTKPLNGDTLELLARQAVLEGAEFWVFPGDLVNGWATGTPTPPTNLKKELLAWQDSVSEAWEDSVRIYPVRGNHEAWNWYYHDWWKSAWDSAFAGPRALPQNGPASQKNLSYYVRHGNSTGDSVLVIGMDQFTSRYVYDPRENDSASLAYMDTTWLRTVLESKGTIKHVFVYGHMPAFRCGRRLGLEADQYRRNRFWKILEEHRVKVYFCAHTHFYSRARIGNGTADTTDDVQQMVVATAGASFYRSSSAPWFPGATYWDGFVHDSTYGGWTPLRRHVDTLKIGYVLAEIDGGVATFTWKEMTSWGVFAPGGDTWQYTVVDSPIAVQLISLAAVILPQGSVQVEWTTMSEINNYGFEVQRSPLPDAGFETIPNSFLPGHGTTITPHSYRFVDSSAAPGLRWYRLKQIDLDGTLHYSHSVEASPVAAVAAHPLPAAYSLGPNYPNPFNPSTTVAYALPLKGHVHIQVFDLVGREVATLVDGVVEAGYHRGVWDGRGPDGRVMGSGVYFCRLEAGSHVELRKMLLLR